MSPRKRRVRIPAILEALIEALEQQEFHDAKGAADALRAFAELAAREVPVRGVLAVDHPELSLTLEHIADRHLGFAQSRRQFFESAGSVLDTELRERVQDNATEMQSISDRASFYAGLAFGITVARFGCRW